MSQSSSGAVEHTTKSALADSEQALLTDHASVEAVCLLAKHLAPPDRLLEKEPLVRDEVEALLADVPVECHASGLVGVSQVVPLVEPAD